LENDVLVKKRKGKRGRGGKGGVEKKEKRSEHESHDVCSEDVVFVGEDSHLETDVLV